MRQYCAIDLPGKILYDKDFSVQIRKITPIEQKYILTLSQKEQKTNKDYINFIKQLVVFDNPQVRFEDLYWYDVQYILYKIRFITYEKYPIKLSFKCKNVLDDGEYCNEKIIQELKIGDLQIVTPDDLPNLKKEVELENLGPTKIRCKIMQDDILIDDFMKRNKISEDDYQMRLLLLDLCMISTDHSLDELYKSASEGLITAQDIITIEDWFKNTLWGVKQEMKVKCPKCGKESLREYVLGLEDFFSAV